MYIFSNSNNDEEFKALRAEGLTGSLNDMQYKYLRQQGFTGSLVDMYSQWLKTPAITYTTLQSWVAPFSDISDLTFVGASNAIVDNNLVVMSLDGFQDRVHFPVSGLTVGEDYRVEIEVEQPTGSGQIRSWTFGTIALIDILPASTVYTIDVTATSTSGLIRIYININGNVGDTLIIKSVKLLQANS